jgi:hypothetical protein
MKLLIALFIAALLVVPIVALADPTPTPTREPLPTYTPSPTLIPISPSPTSKYQGFRITPTPLHITPQPTLQAQFDTVGMTGTFADTIINGYKALNFGGVLDIVSFFAMVLIVIAMLIRIQKTSTRSND